MASNNQQQVTCPYCGATLMVPSAGRTAKCPYCESVFTKPTASQSSLDGFRNGLKSTGSGILNNIKQASKEAGLDEYTDRIGDTVKRAGELKDKLKAGYQEVREEYSRNEAPVRKPSTSERSGRQQARNTSSSKTELFKPTKLSEKDKKQVLLGFGALLAICVVCLILVGALGDDEDKSQETASNIEPIPVEEAVTEITETVDEQVAAADEIVQEMPDAANEAEQSIQEALQDAGQDVQEALQEAADAVQDTTASDQPAPAVPEPEEESIYYASVNREESKKGETGLYAYRQGKSYYNYIIIDMDERYAYFFTDGNGNDICDKVQLTEGNSLNDPMVATYHDGGDVWQIGLGFKHKNNPTTLNYQEYLGNELVMTEYQAVDLDKALEIRNKREIVEY